MTHIRQPNPLNKYIHGKKCFQNYLLHFIINIITNNPSDVHEFLILIY